MFCFLHEITEENGEIRQVETVRCVQLYLDMGQHYHHEPPESDTHVHEPQRLVTFEYFHVEQTFPYYLPSGNEYPVREYTPEKTLAVVPREVAYYFSKRNGKVNEYKNHSHRERQHEVVITESFFHFSPVCFPAQEACSIVF